MEIADAIEEFLTGTRALVTGDRVLATVLFTDIVGSTEKAAKLGDRRWPLLRSPSSPGVWPGPHRQRVEKARAYGLTGRRALRVAAPRPGDHEQAAQGNPVLPLLHGPPHPLNGPMLARFDHSHPRAVSLIDKRVGAKFVTNFRNEKVSGR